MEYTIVLVVKTSRIFMQTRPRLLPKVLRGGVRACGRVYNCCRMSFPPPTAGRCLSKVVWSVGESPKTPARAKRQLRPPPREAITPTVGRRVFCEPTLFTLYTHVHCTHTHLPPLKNSSRRPIQSTCRLLPPPKKK